SLANLCGVRLPPNIRDVTLVADRESEDPRAAEQQLKLLDKAEAAMAAEGRLVRTWRNEWGGKDANDALMAAQGLAS
ncbi:MAG: hypothetical protein AAF192_12035, partial [Pseudomonadota bacterium]